MRGRAFSLSGFLLGLGCGAIGGIVALLGARAGGPGGILGALAGAAIAAAAAGFLASGIFRPAGAAEAPAAASPEPAGPDLEALAKIPEDRTDALTGLANANGLAAWFAERGPRLEEDGKGIVVLVANLDRFDEVERSRGKATAESVLIEVAQRVKVFAGEDGVAARTGGDEFVAIATSVPDHAVEYAEERAGTMAETIGRPVELKTGAMWIGGSVGAAVGRASEGDDILARARMAFAKARRLGLGRYVVDPGPSA
jgi:diguanylate cyclase (GGDEF)-like protein